MIDIADVSDEEEEISAAVSSSTIRVVIGPRAYYFRKDDWGFVRWSE